MKYAAKFTIILALPLMLMLAPACGDENGDEPWTPQLLLQVTETDELNTFNTAVSALQDRGFVAVLLVDGGFASANCERLTTLESQGFEVMQFIRPLDESGEDTTVMSALSRADQRAALLDDKETIEDCLNHAVHGVRMTRFDQNEDTYDVVDALGYAYNLGFVADSSASLPGHQDDVLPYRVEEYDFWAIPMHSVALDGDLKAFCDKPLSSLAPDDWEALMIDELEAMNAERRPLLVEIHPSFLVPQTGRFQAFEDFLDYAEGQGAGSMTVAEYVDWTEHVR